jgi:hypothetical protein
MKPGRPKDRWLWGLCCLVVLAWALLPATSNAVVPAVSPREAPPRVDAHVKTRAASTLDVLALLPFGDAPGAPGSGRLAAEALGRVLASRGVRVTRAAPPVGARGEPTPPTLVGVPELTRIGRQAGVDAVAAGRVLEFHVDERERPNAVVRRHGVYVGVAGEVRLSTRVVVSLRVVGTPSGRLVFSATGRHGPVRDVAPEAVLDWVWEAMMDRWFGEALR